MDLAPGEYDAVLNGILIYYAVRGKGPPLIAHSGGPGFDARCWDDFAGIDQFLTVIAIHPRGSGLSAPVPDDAYLLPYYAADLEALRVHLGLDRPVVMGWSHGGFVGQQYAFTYPDSLSKLILVDTAAFLGDFVDAPERAVLRFKDEPWFEDSLAALKQEWAGEYRTGEDMAGLWDRECKFYFKQYDARAEAYLARLRGLPMQIESLKAFNEREAPSLDLRPRLREIKVPTLVIVGRHDFITNVDMAEEIVRHIPVARLEVFEDSGHFTVIEEPEKFKEVIRQFVLG